MANPTKYFATLVMRIIRTKWYLKSKQDNGYWSIQNVEKAHWAQPKTFWHRSM
jgi:hypothetical protein